MVLNTGIKPTNKLKPYTKIIETITIDGVIKNKPFKYLIVDNVFKI